LLKIMRLSRLETFFGRGGIDALRLIRSSVSRRRSRRFVVGAMGSSADRDLVFQDRKLVSGWRFAPAVQLDKTSSFLN
jgi:hypothetical protein